MFSLFNFSSIFPGGSADPICPYVRTPMAVRVMSVRVWAGAPRLLQAIAADGVIPLLNVFAVTSRGGEPRRAQLLTVLIAECAILLANVDYIAPIIAMSV